VSGRIDAGILAPRDCSRPARIEFERGRTNLYDGLALLRKFLAVSMPLRKAPAASINTRIVLEARRVRLQIRGSPGKGGEVRREVLFSEQVR